MDYNSTHTQVSPRKTDLIRKSQDMSTTIAELSKATLELKKIESKIQNKTPASTLTDQIANNDNDNNDDNNKSYHHQWILDQSTILTIDPLEISSSSSPPPPPPPPPSTSALSIQEIQYQSPSQSTEILNNDISLLPGNTTQSITIAIKMLSSKLDNINHLENKLRIDYDERRYNLQESWDKVSSLRNSHITPLRCLIEQVIIEDIAEKLENGHNSNDVNNAHDHNTDNVPMTSVSIADLQIIREKIRVKEKLVEQVAVTEMSLNDLRKQLSIKTDNLTKGSTDSASTTSTMEQRQQLLAIFKELEVFEKKYVSITVELENVENELAQALTKAMAITDISLDGRLKEEKQVFNLYEVLSGQAAVTRLKGEKAGDFLLRLQSRLETLLVLDNQMQLELEKKTESVQIGKEKLREIEAERLKVESNLRTEEARFDYLIKQKNSPSKVTNLNQEEFEYLSQNNSPSKVTNTYKSPEKLQSSPTQLLQSSTTPNGQDSTHVSEDARTPAQKYWGTPQNGAKFKGVATVRKETSVAVVDVIGRLEQLAEEIENEEETRKSGQRLKKPKSQVIDANKSILDVFDRQRKEVEELRQARKDQQISGVWHSGIKSYASKDKSMRNSDIFGLISPSTMKSTVNDTIDNTFNDTMNDIGNPNLSPEQDHHPTEYSERILKLGILLEKYRQRFKAIADIEYCNPDTGIAMDGKGNSLGLIEVSVLALRNLPAMKKLTSNTDPYVELSLSGIIDNANDSYLEGQDVDSSTMALGANNYDDDLQSGFVRTICKYNCRHAEWREFININPVTNFNQSLLITVKDSSKIGVDFDEVIGYAELPLRELVDQQLHNIRLKIVPPKVRKASYNVRIDDNCNVQLKIRLFYSKKKLFFDKIMSLESQIKAELECPQVPIITQSHKNKKKVDTDAHVLIRDVVGLREINHKDMTKLKERNEWLDPSLYLSKRDFRLAEISKQNTNVKRNTNTKSQSRSRSLSPGKTVKKPQAKKISFQELYMKGNNIENIKSASNNNNNDSKNNIKPKPKRIVSKDDTNVTPKNINMNIFKAACFRSNELIAIKEYKPKQLNRFNGGKTYF